MKHIKKFNEVNIDMQKSRETYINFLNTMKECFLEFTDEGWEWATNNVFPFFDYILYRYKPKQIGEEKIDIRGSISESGEIKYISNIDDINNEETKDFIVAVKRINQMTGIGFLFSYYNKNTYRRIIIESSFTPLIDGKNSTRA